MSEREVIGGNGRVCGVGDGCGSIATLAGIFEKKSFSFLCS